MADAIVKAATTQIGSLLVEEGRALYAVKRKVESLYRELDIMYAFLREMDSRNQGEHSEVVHKAISWIRDLAYEAEDIVEMYANGVTHKRELEEIAHTLKWFFCGLICNPCDAAAQHQVGADIDVLRENLQQVTSQLQRYTIGGSVCVGSSASERQQVIENKAFLNLLEDDPIGLDQATEDLAEKFADANIKVVSISGMGGIGKSTLAKKLYKMVQNNNEFDCFAWVFVSQQFQRAHVWKNVIDRLGKDTKDIIDIDLPHTLDHVFRSERCLVVLDDLWNEADWDQLKPAFLPIINHECGSKLLVTTRRRELLEQLDPTGYLYELQALTEEQSCDLFKTKIRPKNVLDDLNKTKLGEKMVSKCKGLPLAIIALAGILSKKKTVEEWNIVNSSLKNIHQDRNGIVMQVLELSYNDLHHYLKPCFLYLAIYPEDDIVSVEKLQHLWEAEGFLELRLTITEDTLKNVGMSYLIELAERFLIIINRKTRSEKIKEIYLHDMIRDMCINKAKEENFLHTVTKGEESGVVLLDGTPIRSEFQMRVERMHRLAVHRFNDEGSLKFASTNLFKKWSHVRSLVLFDVDRHNPQLASYIIKGATRAFSSLRVLDTGGAGKFSSFPMRMVGGLKFLRYLCLEGSDLKLVPLCIQELRCLITLDLRVSYTCNPNILPNSLVNLKRLKHLYLPQNGFRCVGGCSLNLNSLTRLETLVNFSVNKCSIKDLYKLTNLKKFRINYECFNYTTRRRIKHLLKCYATLSNACTKPFLICVNIAILLREPNSLQRLWETSVGDPSLYQLYLKGPMEFYHSNSYATFESVFPSNLEYLTIDGIELDRDPVQMLKNKLPQLKCLCLSFCLSRKLRELVYSEGEFPKLATLVLRYLFDVEKLKLEKGAMSNLIRLCIHSCTRLHKIDIFDGGRAKEITIIHNSVSELEAYWTSKRGCKERAIRQEWEDMGHENTRIYKRRITAHNIEDESVDKRNRAHSVDGSTGFSRDTISISDGLNINRSRSWG